MNLFDITLVWIHLTAATFWVGGMLFLSLVAVPLLKKAPDPASAQREFVNLARRFRMLVWGALALLLATGLILLPNLVDLSESLGNWPLGVLIKVSLVFLLIITSVTHDRIIGPKARTLKHKLPSELTVMEKLLLRLSPLISRMTLFLGLAILLAAVFMVRF
jgi:putative copper resistance protein D